MQSHHVFCGNNAQYNTIIINCKTAIYRFVTDKMFWYFQCYKVQKFNQITNETMIVLLTVKYKYLVEKAVELIKN